ncbi:carbohydrate kinase family protein [Salinifilum aidingensis]
MRIAVTGSIATDHLMSYSGRIKDEILADQLDSVSLSFLVDELEVRRGGIAGNITFGLGQLGISGTLVGAVGRDFADYGKWLESHGVDTGSVHWSERKHTARFVCTTDQDSNQIASFYPGAMSEAAQIELKTVAERLGGVDLVVISANDPGAMVQYTEEARQRNYPFLADPGQQLAIMDGENIRKLVDDARYLFTNEYERSLLLQKTGWSEAEVLDRVGIWVTSLGPEGVQVESKTSGTVRVQPPKEKQKGDPTGVGDALRAGFLAGLHHELGLERSLQLGCTLATVSLETDGPQEYEVESGSFVARFAEAYGDAAAAEVESKLR